MSKSSTTTTPVVTPTKQEKAKAFKATHPAPDLGAKKGRRAVQVIGANPPTETSAKKGPLANLSPKEREEQVSELLDDLRNEKDPDQKKRIRRALRARGHYGGLGSKGAAKPDAEA